MLKAQTNGLYQIPELHNLNVIVKVSNEWMNLWRKMTAEKKGVKKQSSKKALKGLTSLEECVYLQQGWSFMVSKCTAGDCQGPTRSNQNFNRSDIYKQQMSNTPLGLTEPHCMGNVTNIH